VNPREGIVYYYAPSKFLDFGELPDACEVIRIRMPKETASGFLDSVALIPKCGWQQDVKHLPQVELAYQNEDERNGSSS
jgi:hypothetical protein